MTSDNPDTTQFDAGDRIRIVLTDDETFEGEIVESDHSEPTNHSQGWTRFVLEGDWWDQIKDRVGLSTLYLNQTFTRRSGDPQTPVLLGLGWPDGEHEKEPKDVKMGDVDSITKVGSNDQDQEAR